MAFCYYRECQFEGFTAPVWLLKDDSTGKTRYVASAQAVGPALNYSSRHVSRIAEQGKAIRVETPGGPKYEVYQVAGTWYPVTNN